MPAYAWVVLCVVMLAGVTAPLNQFKVPPLMPALMERFQLGLSTAGLLMSIFAITGFALALPAGIILQKLGPKVTGLTAIGCLLVGSVLGALSTGANFLLASRLVEGAGMGLIAVVAPATIAIWFPAENRGLPMGIWATWVSLGSLIIYNLAPALNTIAGWQAAWWAGAGFALVAFSLYWLFIRMPSSLEASTPGTGVTIKNQPGLNLRQALGGRSIWLLALSFCCFNFVVIGVIATYFPTYLKVVHGYSLAEASMVTSLKMVMVILTAPLAGWLSDRVGSSKRILLVSLAVLAVYVLFPFSVGGGLAMAAMIVLGIIAGAIPTATFSAVPEAMGNLHSAGIGMGVIMMGQNLGQLLGPLVFGTLVESAGWAVAGYWMLPVLIIAIAAAWFTKIR